MLNISLHRINDKVDKTQYESFNILRKKSIHGMLIGIIVGVFFVVLLSMFLPWTQNIRAKGYVTTLSPDDRPQTVQSLIGGRIENWYVQEGQQVKAGDTIIMISEVKEEYLDPEILDRTDNQITAKNQSANAYAEKANNLASQLSALERSREIKLEQNTIKLEQTRLKLQSDSMDLVANRLKLEIADNQLSRMEEMYENGLKSLTDVEAKRLSFREAQAKVISLENALDAHRNEILNLNANFIAIENDYAEKLAKTSSERMSALSDQYNANADMNKLQSQYNSYSVRRDNYFIRSPISGTVTKAIKYGIGEIIKNGEMIVSIMPDDYQLAVEMYVEPMDMPLLDKNQKVRIQFDGWPAMVFSGWPDNSFGTFGGKIFAIDKLISDNGKYRVLVAPDEDDAPWPDQIWVGGGANTITLLKRVKLGYEIWRQLNGFPPDYYISNESEDIKTKAPLRSFK